MDKQVPEAYYVKEGVRTGLAFASPVKIDCVDDTDVFLGYAKFYYDTLEQSETLLIKRVTDDTLGNITIRHAYGEWADRTTLTYI